MRYLLEFLGAISAMVMALLAFTIPPGKPRGAVLRYSLLLAAVVICVGSLLYRGFTGKGIDDAVATFLVDHTCRFIDLAQCAERDNDKRKVEAEAKRISGLAAAKVEQDRKAAEAANQRELDILRLKTEVDNAKQAALDAERQQFAAQKLATEKAEEARRLKDTEEARIKALATLPQMKNGKLISLSSLRVRLIYEKGPDDLQAIRGVRQVVGRLNGTIVGPGDVADVEMHQTLKVVNIDKLGIRNVQATLSIDCRQPRVSSSCFAAPFSVSGVGDGPNFGAATERAIDDAISTLERQFIQAFASRP